MKNSKKTNKGSFTKGTSGNAAGRPLGSRNHATIMIESMLAGQAEQLIQKTLELAMNGDTQAIRFCLDRLMPPGKDRLVFFEFPEVKGPRDCAAGITSIMAAVSTGQLTPTEGEILSRILADYGKVMTADDVEIRLLDVEHPQDDGSSQAIDPSLN